MPFARNMTSSNLENSIRVMPRSINCFCSWFNFEPDQELKWWDEPCWTSLTDGEIWSTFLVKCNSMNVIWLPRPYLTVQVIPCCSWFHTGHGKSLNCLVQNTPNFLVLAVFFHSALSYIRQLFPDLLLLHRVELFTKNDEDYWLLVLAALTFSRAIVGSCCYKLNTKHKPVKKFEKHTPSHIRIMSRW